MPDPAPARQRVIPEKAGKPLRCDVRKPESADALKELGECLDAARAELKWNLEQLAGALDRDARQVRRWIAGEERTQVDVVMQVPQLRGPFVEAMARAADEDFEIETTIRRRRG